MHSQLTLTERQREIKDLLDRGFGAREIAEQLGITRNAVYQQIQRLRDNGALPRGYTPTGLPAREQRPGMELLAELVHDSNGDGVEHAGMLALVNELKRTRDELDSISRRLSAIVPR